MSLDPQERLFLQTTWAALEDAAYTRARLAQQHQGQVGVFAGITKTGFELYGPALWQQGKRMMPRTSFKPWRTGCPTFWIFMGQHAH